jgi:hypothetical protein
MILTLPPNLVKIDGAEITVAVNGQSLASDLHTDTLQLTVEAIPSNNEYTIKVGNGFKNPTEGPYAYSVYQVEFYTSNPESDGYLIDKVFSQHPWIDVPCLNNCGTCTGTLSSCVSCSYNSVTEVSRYLEDGECVEECKAGFYGGSGYNCLPCESPCLECSLLPNLCTLCEETHDKPFAYPVALQCYAECPNGTYLDEELRQCVACELPCGSCSSATTCLSCAHASEGNYKTTFFEEENMCYEDCPPYAVKSPDNQCLRCAGNCETCDTLQSTCASCSEGTFLHKSQCVDSCPFLTW